MWLPHDPAGRAAAFQARADEELSKLEGVVITASKSPDQLMTIYKQLGRYASAMNEVKKNLAVAKALGIEPDEAPLVHSLKNILLP